MEREYGQRKAHTTNWDASDQLERERGRTRSYPSAPRKGVVRDVRPLIPGDRRLITKHWEDIAREWTCDNITRGLHDSGRQGTEGIRFRPFLMKT